jgi:hypothetical protein
MQGCEDSHTFTNVEIIGDKEIKDKADQNIINDIIYEYNLYVHNNEILIDNIKKNNQLLIQHFHNNKLSCLENFLLKNIDSVGFTKKKYQCDLCMHYFSNTKKGIAAHKRGCKKKHLSQKL